MANPKDIIIVEQLPLDQKLTSIRILIFDWEWHLLGEKTVDLTAGQPTTPLEWHRLCMQTMEQSRIPYEKIKDLHITAGDFTGPVTEQIIAQLKIAHEKHRVQKVTQFHIGHGKPSEYLPDSLNVEVDHGQN